MNVIEVSTRSDTFWEERTCILRSDIKTLPKHIIIKYFHLSLQCKWNVPSEKILNSSRLHCHNSRLSFYSMTIPI